MRRRRGRAGSARRCVDPQSMERPAFGALVACSLASSDSPDWRSSSAPSLRCPPAGSPARPRRLPRMRALPESSRSMIERGSCTRTRVSVVGLIFPNQSEMQRTDADHVRHQGKSSPRVSSLALAARCTRDSCGCGTRSGRRWCRSSACVAANCSRSAARHAAVVAHDLAEHRGGRESGDALRSQQASVWPREPARRRAGDQGKSWPVARCPAAGIRGSSDPYGQARSWAECRWKCPRRPRSRR